MSEIPTIGDSSQVLFSSVVPFVFTRRVENSVLAWLASTGPKPGFRVTIDYDSQFDETKNYERAAIALRATLASKEGSSMDSSPFALIRCQDHEGGCLFAFLSGGKA